MKITKALNLLLLVMLTAFSCDALDELTEFDITEDFSTTFNIDVPNAGEGMSATFMNSATIDLASNQDIQDNLDVIQNVTLNALTYEIMNFSGAEGAMITEASLNLGSTTISVAAIDLQQSDTDNEVYTITDTSLLNAIASALESSTAITASVTGTVNATPVTFDVEINLDVTVSVDLL
jgi:hypothetical protein